MATFGSAVTVVGVPTISIDVNGVTRTASYVSGSGTTALTFRYTVAAGEEDTNGITIPSLAITLPVGASIVDTANNNAVGLPFSLNGGLTLSGVKVDGKAPVILAAGGITMPAGGVYTSGNGAKLSFTVNFDDAVTYTKGTSDATIAVTIGSTVRQATIQAAANGTTATSFTFEYTLQSGDASSGNVAIGANAITLSGSTFRDAATNDATLAATTASASNIVVNRLAATVNINGGTGKTYKAGDAIDLVATFGGTVTVTGSPTIALTVGSAPKTATYISGTGTSAIKFRYTVVASDLDTDGIDVPGLAIVGGSILDVGGNAVATTFTAPVNLTAVLVDGVVPTVTLTPPAGNTYKTGDTLSVSVAFNDNVTYVKGALDATLPITIGTLTRQAVYDSVSSTSTNFVFSYTILVADSTAGTISLGQILLNGSTVRDTNGNDANLAFVPSPITNVVINRLSATVTVTGRTYKIGDAIDLVATFGGSVTVTGTPTIALTVGTASKTATYISGTGTNTIKFRYTVAAGDLDTDGIDVPGLGIVGGSIVDAGGSAVSTTFSPPANLATVLIDGVAPQTLGTIAGPGAGSYKTNDTISFTVPFNDTVTVTGTPTLALTIGGVTRQASYSAGTGTTTLTFDYTVVAGDAATSILLAANAISLSGGTVKDAAGNDATLANAANTFNGVNINRLAATVTVTSGSGKTSKIGDVIELTATFAQAVNVTGTPSIGLTVGSTAKTASYVSGTGTTALKFRYTIVAGDLDSDGVDVIGIITLPGTATLVDATGAVPLSFTAPATTTVLVDGVAPQTLGTIAGPGAGSYQTGNKLSFTVPFNDTVTVTGTPTLAFTIGGITRQANYSNGTGTTTLTFDYTIVAGDAATSITIAANAISTSGGTVKDAAGNDATLATAASTFNGIAVNRLAPTLTVSGKTYKIGDAIDLVATFGGPVTVTGSPTIALTVGTAAKTATYISGTGTSAIKFRYTVVAGDLDTDGIDVPGLAIVGGTIVDAGSNAVATTFTAPVNLTAVLVDGVVPTVTLTPPAGNTYKTGDTLSVSVAFNDNVTYVKGALDATLPITIGTLTRQAVYDSVSSTSTNFVFSYTILVADSTAGTISLGQILLNGSTVRDTNGNDANLAFVPSPITNVVINRLSATVTVTGRTYKIGDAIDLVATFGGSVTVTGTPTIALTVGTASKTATYISGTGTNTIKFRYTVAAGDLDTDGIDVPGLGIVGGSIVDAGGSAVSTTFSPPANLATVLIDGVAPQTLGTIAGPGAGSYKTNDTISFTVPFNDTVTVTGTPTLALTIGGVTRQASYSAGTGTTTLTFDYTVVAGDAATSILLAANAISLSGGTVKDAAGNDATLANAANTFNGVNINRLAATVTVTSGSGKTSKIGDVIELTATFAQAVNVTGTPSIGLTVGSTAKTASYVSGTGTTALKFRYTIVAGDLDSDGVDVIGIITLPGTATLVDATGAVPLSFTAPATTTVLVDGVAPQTLGTIAGPGAGSYQTGNKLSFTVPFNDTVTVTGTPTLAFTIGGITRQANYSNGTGTTTLTFDYTVVASDAATSVVLAANAISLSGGTVKDAAGNDAALASGASTFTGVNINRISSAVGGVSISSGSTRLYKLGEAIDFAVTFNKPVTVTGSPQLAFTIGGTPTVAAYLNGSGTTVVTFRHVVTGTEVDADGIDMTTSSITLAGGATIVDGVGNAADLTFSPPVTTGVTVDGQVPTVLANGVILPYNGSYKLGDTLTFTFTMSEPVVVTGSPRLPVTIGPNVRIASFVAPASSPSKTLTFQYTVLDTDIGPVSISLGSLVLGTATVRDVAGNDANLGYTAPSTAAILVDGAKPTATSIRGQTNGTYTTGNTISIQVTFSENVVVKGLPPTLRLNSVPDTAERYATYTTGSGTNTLTFRYVVQDGDASPDLDYFDSASLIVALSSSIRDAAGNDADLTLAVPGAVNSIGFQNDIVIDTLPPSVVSFTSNTINGSYNAGKSVRINATLSEPIAAGRTFEVTLDTGEIVRLTTNGTTTASGVYEIKPGQNSPDLTVVDLAPGTLLDSAGNPLVLTLPDAPNNLADTKTIVVDTVAPTVTIVSSKAALKIGETATITFTLSEPSTNFTTADVTVSGGTISPLTGAGTAYTATFTPAANSTTPGAISVAANAFTDAATNGNQAATLAAPIVIDTVAPTVVITSDRSVLKAGETATITFTLSENSSTFADGDVSVTGGTLSSISGTGSVYTAVFTPATTSTAPGQISVAAGMFTDIAGNSNNASLVTTLSIDTVVPAVVITSDKANLRVGQTATITFTLTENSTTFTKDSVTVAGGTLSGFSGTGTVYTATFTPTAQSTTPGSVVVNANAFTDAAGNGNTIGMLTPALIINTLVPKVTVTSNVPALKAGEKATISFKLSVSTNGFTDSDITTVGGTLSPLSGSGDSYSAEFTPAANSTSPGQISVAANAFTDTDGNANAAGQLAVPLSIDTQLPGLLIAASKSSLKIGDIATITFTLSEYSSTFADGDVSVTGGTLSSISGTGSVYTAVFTPAANFEGSGTLSVAANAFTDAAGNGNTAFSLPLFFAIDTIAPTIAISSSKSALKIGETATITFTLSESSTDFIANDVTITGGTISALSGSGRVYTATFTPAANSTTPGAISVAANAFTDAAGNGNIAGALSPTITIDTVAPTVAITSSKTALKIGETAIITFTLSEPSTNFAEADVTYSGGTLSGFAGAGTAYTATFTPTASSMTAGSISVAANSFTDSIGNGNVAAALAAPISIDTIAPTIAITSSQSTLKIGDTAIIMFTLSEASTDFTTADVTVSGGTISPLTGSGTVYSATFTPTGNSTAAGVISVAVNSFKDAAGNGNTAGALSPSITIDTVAPTVAISTSKASLKSGETATITFTLSEVSTDFTTADVIVSGGTISPLTGSGTVYSATFTPTANSTAPGAISVAVNSFKDAAGNGNTAGALSPSISIDTVAPTVTISTGKASLKSGETATITFTLSEPSNTFTLASIAATGGTLSDFVGSGASYTATFTPTDNSTTAGTISVATDTFTDVAGNRNVGGSLPTPIAIDTMPPGIVSFGSPVTNGTYTAGAVIPIVATLSEAVRAGSTISVTLSTNAVVTLTALYQGTTLTGTYTVQPGETTFDLDVIAYQLTGNSVVDLAGNAITTPTLPNTAGRLATLKNIAVDATIKVSSGAGFSTNPGVIADKRSAVTAVPITFSAPVSGVSLSAFRLYLNGRSVSLKGASVTGSGANYVLRLPARATSAKALYTLQIVPTTGIRATSNGAAMTQTLQIFWGNGRSLGMTPTPRALAFARK